MRRNWSRPLFGPFRRIAKTGVPADHFPKAALMRDGRMVALVADGEPDEVPVEMWWFPNAEARDAFVAGLEWQEQTDTYDEDVRDRLLAELAAHGATRDPIDGGEAITLSTLDPLALHGAFSGVHSHEHSHNGVPHTHAHYHADNAAHRHSHNASVLAEWEHQLSAAPAEPEPASDPSPGAGSPLSRLSEAERRRIDGENEVTDPEALAALVASAFAARGGPDALEQLRHRKGLTAATLPDGSVEPAAWHAYLCAEGIRTDDGRELVLGACRFPDLPVSMRLLVEDEGGHWGAVTCGRIDTMERQEREQFALIYSAGMFGSDTNGQLAELMVEEQTQRFVSIDPRDATAEWIEVRIDVGRAYSDDEDGVYDCWMRILDCVIGAATIVAMPAIQNAVITLASVALPDAPIATAAAPPSLPAEMDPQQAVAASAAGGAVERLPRADWFDDPGFHVGDPRLVLQEDERSHACPLTISDPDPVTGLRSLYAHVAWWNCDHTGMRLAGKRVKPPRSKSGYAYYNLGPAVECQDGVSVTGIGKITMGCGHAPLTKRAGSLEVPLSPQEAAAHYDGGYGAKVAAFVRAGEDDFGPWVAGFVNPALSDDELREFMTLSLSGDWRELGGELDMIACLAVPVPGFPVRRALAASGAPELDVCDFRAGEKDGRVFALVAHGVVRRQSPEQRIAHLEHTVARLSVELERTTDALGGVLAATARSRHGL